MANLIKSKTVVLDRRTSKNPSIDLGDFVTCCNCGRMKRKIPILVERQTA